MKSEAGHYRLELPTPNVDLWWLESFVESGASPTPSDLERALAGRPLDDIGGGQLVDDARRLAEFHQRSLLGRFETDIPDDLPDGCASALVRFAVAEWHDDAVVQRIVHILTHCNREPEAERLLSLVLDRYQSEEMQASSALVQLHSNANSERRPDPPAPIGQRVVQSRLHPALDLTRAGPLIGRQSELAHLVSPRTLLLLLGETGLGRTRLIAEATYQLRHAGADYIYITALDDDAPPLAPLHVALPTLAHLHLPAATDVENMAREIHSHVRFLIDNAEMATHPLHYIVDDAHALDVASFEVIRRLMQHSLTAGPLVVKVAGDPNTATANWLAFQRQIDELDVPKIMLGAVTQSDVYVVAQRHFPYATHDARSLLADEILELSAGVPGMVAALLEATDPGSLALHRTPQIGRRAEFALADLGAHARAIAVVAAVLGREFRVGTAIHLSELPVADAEQALDDLWNREFIDETDEADIYRFRDASFWHACLASAPLFRIHSLHEQAFDLETELHRRAEHCFQASSRMPVELTAKLLQASAEAYLAESEWRRAARQCERIDGLRGNDTSVEVLITWAEALDLSGRDGAEARSRAFDRCVANADWERAAAAALSGLPGAEHTGGDPVRRSQLERIRLDALAPGLRFRVVCQLSRLSSLEGDANAAHHWSAVALELADDEAERATAHITAWTTHHHHLPGAHPFPPDTLNTAGVAGARIRQMQAISAFEANDLGESRERHHEFVERAEQLADPLRIWHARCFSAVLAMGDGDLARSLELAESAYEFGTQHGFREAASARVAHLFVDALDRNALDSIAPMFDQARNNLSRSLIGQAALSVVDVAQGTEERGRAMAVRVANNALDSPGSMALPAIAIVASVVAEAGDEKLRRRCRRFLAPFESTSIVMGFGIGALGPCSRFIAELAGDAEERTDSLMRSVSLADQLGARYWRVLCRLRLADHVDDSTIRDVARALAAGTELELLTG